MCFLFMSLLTEIEPMNEYELSDRFNFVLKVLIEGVCGGGSGRGGVGEIKLS